MDRLIQLANVNAQVNRAIVYMTDKDNYGISEHFAYPKYGFGDCEDFALEKRRRLIELGWPRRALLLVVVKPIHPPEGAVDDLHMLLVARTLIGDFYLDMRDDEPAIAVGNTHLDYRIVAVQSQDKPIDFLASPSWLK
jgi:predicted transglutaminase-like cysteine proteinase